MQTFIVQSDQTGKGEKVDSAGDDPSLRWGWGEVLSGIHEAACSNRLSLLWIWGWINAKRQGRWISFFSGPVSDIFRHLQAHSCSGNTWLRTKPARRKGRRGGPVETSSIITALCFEGFFLFRGHFLQMWFTMTKYIGLYYGSNLVTALPISRLQVPV